VHEFVKTSLRVHP